MWRFMEAGAPRKSMEGLSLPPHYNKILESGYFIKKRGLVRLVVL
jgi:hypothetical protein